MVAALGDSITPAPGYDPDPAQRAALGFGDDERSQYEYWAERAEPGVSSSATAASSASAPTRSPSASTAAPRAPTS